MFVHAGGLISARLEGVVVKQVTCEQCGYPYAYRMYRKAEGTGFSLLHLNNLGAERRARRHAETALRRKLERECDLVPCPRCGWYQKAMVAAHAQLRYRGLPIIGIILTGLGVLLSLAFWIDEQKGGVGPGSWSYYLAFSGGGLFLIALGKLLEFTFNPNARQTQEFRKELGQSLSVPIDEQEATSGSEAERAAYWTDDQRRAFCLAKGIDPAQHCCLDIAWFISEPVLWLSQGPTRVLLWFPEWNEYRIDNGQRGGKTSTLLRFCPWCGQNLGQSKREEWYRTLRELGYKNPGAQDVPEEFRSDRWWRTRSR